MIPNLRLSPQKRYQGKAEQVRWVGPFLVCRYYYAPGVRLEKHIHPGPFVSVTIGGHFREAYQGTTLVCAPETATYHPPEELHSNSFEKGTTILMLDLENAARCSGVVEHLSPQRLEFTAVRALGRQICREFTECCSTSDLIIESLAHEVLSNCMRPSQRGRRRRTPPWLAAVVEFANDRFADSLTLTEVSAVVGVHPMHLARHFHMRFGCTFGEYLRWIRLSRARAQMTTQSKSLAEIASECGFADQSHFTRLFGEAFGISPARYRRLL